MTRSFIRLLVVSISLSLLLPVVVWICSRIQLKYSWTILPAGVLILSLVTVAVLIFLIRLYLQRISAWFENLCLEQAHYIDGLPVKYIGPAILVSSAASLFLELAVIRWQGGIFPVFAFYKNYSLLSCFAGLGLGYALASRKSIPLIFSVPLLSIQMLLLTGLRYGFDEKTLDVIWRTPFREQLNMAIPIAQSSPTLIAVYLFLATVFLLTALAFIPVGQLCGRLMNRKENLSAYGFNLLGSILGVAAITAVSFLWTPPPVWFAICFAALLLFQGFRPRLLMTGVLASLASLIILDWPVSPGFEKIHTPYQLLERGPGYRGWTNIQAAGFFYQQIVDLSQPGIDLESDPTLKTTSAYYQIPYLVFDHRLEDVAVVGSGTGNDVAAALRAGAGRLDAIEIDPGILRIGRMYHPEKPYDDPRVTAHVNDARTFLRNTDRLYDMIVYGLLDSHTLLSHASSIRLDSFVYTVEGLREARNRLKEGGVVSLSFCVMTDELGHKIHSMMTEAFDGAQPVCILAATLGSQGLVTYLQSREGTLHLDPEWFRQSGFIDASERYSNPSLKTDDSTDDWPFFYMPRRVYPATYIGIMVMIMLLSVILTANFSKEKPSFSGLVFFLMGAGFMLVETKAITEMGLVFGNTWIVIGIVIVSLLIMAYLANLAVQLFGIRKSLIPFILLIASLGAGYAVSRAGGFDSSVTGKIMTVALLTCPLFFSGIVFSTLLRRSGNIAGVIAVNMLGAMLGGLLEYNSMYFGFSFLYLLAALLYFMAAVASVFRIESTRSVTTA